MMRFILNIFLLVLFLAALGGGGLAYGRFAFVQPGPLNAPKDVMIARGSGLRGIASTLADNDVVRNAYIFVALSKLYEGNIRLKAGEYEFPAAASIEKTLDMLAKGDVVIHKVTVPEGLTSWQIVQILDHTDGLTGSVDPVPPEGSMLPQTYSFLRGDDKRQIVQRMQSAMTKTLERLWTGRSGDTPVKSPADAITLASIVEKETGVPTERAHVASVFANRLRQGMPLQSDPTVIYALTQGHIQENGMGPLGRALTTADLQTSSPYNTYKNSGLPPGPIANPGEQAIAAVLNPQSSNDLYFVANGTGGHVFAATLEEHNRNVEQWRQIRQQQMHPAMSPLSSPAGR